MTQEQEQVHSQASEDALTEARKLSDERCPHLEYYGVSGRVKVRPRATSCDQCVALLLDRVSRERTRQALERAATKIENMAVGGARYDLYGTGWNDCSKRGAAAIRGLSDGESVASEEKEE